MLTTVLLQGLEQNNLDKTLSLWDLILKGGVLMIPIFILALAAIYIFIERYLTINAASQDSRLFMDQIREKVKTGNIDEAKSLCKNTNTPISRMVAKGLARIGTSMKDIEVSIENVGKVEINRLEKSLPFLATIAGAAPMIGFLGTVIGMIKTFMELDKTGEASGAQLAGGIYEALITTVGGLVVGIIAYVAYNALAAMIQKIIHRMEHTSVDFIDLLHEPQ